MPWRIRWTAEAARDLAGLDRTTAHRIVAKLEHAAGNPKHYFERLVGADDYKLRIGDHRLLAALRHEDETILVERVDHRSRIYQRRR